MTINCNPQPQPYSQLQGVEGRYITLEPGKRSATTPVKWEFVVDETLDGSLKDFAVRILPLCAHYATICQFIEARSDFAHGLVSQALCSAMRALLKEHVILVAQLEHLFKQVELDVAAVEERVCEEGKDQNEERNSEKQSSE